LDHGAGKNKAAPIEWYVFTDMLHIAAY
jgi:hypothetical protein